VAVLTAVAAGDGAAASAAAPVNAGGGAAGSSARTDPAKALVASKPHDAMKNEKR